MVDMWIVMRNPVSMWWPDLFKNIVMYRYLWVIKMSSLQQKKSLEKRYALDRGSTVDPNCCVEGCHQLIRVLFGKMNRLLPAIFYKGSVLAVRRPSNSLSIFSSPLRPLLGRRPSPPPSTTTLATLSRRPRRRRTLPQRWSRLLLAQVL